MRRFSLIGRAGPSDNAGVEPIQGDSAVFKISLADGSGTLGFGIGQAIRDLCVLGLRPPETAVDLVVLATMVQAGDTRVSRNANGQDGWTRELDLYVPVSEPNIWKAVAQDLEYLLKYLTGDRWRLVFRARSVEMAPMVTDTGGVKAADIDGVSLLSGGLDSFIGAADELAAERHPLLVSHYWDGETASAQTRVIEALRGRFGESAVRSIRVRVGFTRNDLATGEDEKTQRGRSFHGCPVRKSLESATCREV